MRRLEIVPPLFTLFRPRKKKSVLSPASISPTMLAATKPVKPGKFAGGQFEIQFENRGGGRVDGACRSGAGANAAERAARRGSADAACCCPCSSSGSCSDSSSGSGTRTGSIGGTGRTGSTGSTGSIND